MATHYETWTEDEIALLLKLSEQFSEGEISRKIGKSRNSIVGKLRRLRGKPTPKEKIRVYQTKKNVSKPARQSLDLPVIPSSEGKDILELTNKDCVWPLWGDKERPNQRFCGQKIEIVGASYCNSCLRKAYQKSDRPDRKRLGEGERIH